MILIPVLIQLTNTPSYFLSFHKSKYEELPFDCSVTKIGFQYDSDIERVKVLKGTFIEQYALNSHTNIPNLSKSLLSRGSIFVG